MKAPSFILSLLILLLVGCTPGEQDSPEEKKDELNPTIAKIIEAHGGLENWQDMHTLSFDLEKQSHTIDLKTREVKITAPHFSMGNDDGTVWISGSYDGSPTFYHSLMFYFYAMPFVFADDGIIYEQMPKVQIKGRSYGALKISYEEGIGDSPEDEYIIYYDPETGKMKWLAYTVTFQSREESDDFHIIHYKEWEKINGLLLPTALQWHVNEDGEIGDARGAPRTFTNIRVTDKDMADHFYAMPEGASVDSAGAK